MTKTFDMIMTGLDEVEGYFKGDRAGFVGHIPSEVDVRSIRQRLHLTQPKFAETFGFSVGRVRDWEQKRTPVEAPLRVFLTVIDKEPEAVLRALSINTPTAPSKSKRPERRAPAATPPRPGKRTHLAGRV
jgi:putative transcriptional regulator